FVLGRDINEEAQNVREKVAVGMKLLPTQAQPPIITKVDPDAAPVITLVVSGADMSLRTTTEVADKFIKRALEAVDGVGQVPQTGAWLDGKEAVVLDVQRQSGENTLRVIEAVKRKLRLIASTLPPSMSIVVTRDDSRFINASITSLEEHLFWGSLLASLVVMFFIRNSRAVLISSLAIPTSIVATFTLMRAMGFTLNNMTLLGLTLAVGIVIDDAIVVLENVFRYIEEKGHRPFEAAIAGTREVSLAVLAT